MYTGIFLIGFFLSCFTSAPSLSLNHQLATNSSSAPFANTPKTSTLDTSRTDTRIPFLYSAPSGALAVAAPTQTNSSHENTSLFIPSSNASDPLIDNSISTPKFATYINRLDVATYKNHSDENETDDDLDEKIRMYMKRIQDFIFPTLWEWVFIACHIFVFIVGLLGNILVCVAVYRNYAMRTVTNYFIVNLAVADFLVILCCLPPTLIWDITSTWFFGTYMCKIVLYVQTVSVTLSVLTLTFISIDRWYAICYPLRFKSTTRRAQTAICLIWLVSLTLDIPELIVNEASAYQHDYALESVYFTQCVPTWSATIERNFTISRIVLLYFLPLLLMSVFYVQIVCVLWQSGTVTHNGVSGTRQFNFSMVSNASTRGQLRSRKKAAKMLVSVVGMFAFCYFPVHMISFMRLVVRMSNNEFNNAVAMISHWLCYANSALNPIIYNFMSGKFRKEFHRTMKCTTHARASRLELNTVLKTPARKTFSGSSLGRTDTTRVTIAHTT